MIDYKITRSSRKTMAIYIHKDGSVEVKCPKKLSEDSIKKFVASKQAWIDKKVKLMQDKNEKREEFHLKPGSRLRFLGELYPIAEGQASKVGFDGTQFYIPLNLPEKEIKQNIIKLYKILAKNYLTNRIKGHEQRMQTAATNVKINSAKTRWGSCSGKGNINFSWRIIMADEAVVDYLIVHELAHTIEHNHSDRFWAVVRAYMPDYKEQEKKLKMLQRQLAVEDWD